VNKNIADEMSSVENENKVIEMFSGEFYPLFIKERRELLSTIIHEI